MYYLGFKIEAQYFPGDNFQVLEDGRFVDTEPTKIAYYRVTSTYTGWRYRNCLSTRDAKDVIDGIYDLEEAMLK